MSERLIALFKATFGEAADSCEALKAHASDRAIFRLRSAKRSVIGISNANRVENQAFIEFTKHFAAAGLPVPQIYASDLDADIYLEEDLGDTTLFDELQKHRTAPDPFPKIVEALYVKTIELLPRLQIEAGRTVPLRFCVASRSFSEDSILWDMHDFRDSFLKGMAIVFNAGALEADFHGFMKYLLEEAQQDQRGPYFMFRDFQARNIMVRDGMPYFIDYQSGRQGPLQYDVASLLYQSRADIPDPARARVLERYLDAAAKHTELDRARFMTYFPSFVLIRMMQVLGTYARQGLGRGKDYFSSSIPYARKNVAALLTRGALPAGLPELRRVLEKVGET